MSNNTNTMLKVGMVLNDKWVVLEFIGKGGMGEVYRAHQVNLKRDVAIKVVSQEWLQSLADDEEEIEIALKRFRIEVEAMAQARHPNILQIYDFATTPVKTGEEEILIEYIVMEYIPGGTLRDTMSEEGFAPEEDLTKNWLLNYFLPVLDGVEAMHNLGIIHRDLKPENIFMDGKIPKIADFGLARSFKLKPVTRSVDVKGTPAYMSPEHFFDLKHADERADIYSLGKILFEAIEGKMTSRIKPFKSVGLSEPGTPFFRKLDRIIRDATAEDREKRIASVEKFQDLLKEAVEVPGERGTSEVSKASAWLSMAGRPKLIWAGIAAALISMALMTLWHIMGEPKRPISTLKAPLVIEKKEKKPELTKPYKVDRQPSTALVQSFVAEDGVNLHLVPGGVIRLPDRFTPASEKRLEINPFYMDETQVTNHQYVNFLNQILSEIRVEKGVVQGAGKIWLLLGEIEKGYEPIVFRKGKFHVKNSAYASHPVLRVTAYGASAYARYYGRRLPSVAEWLYSATEGSGKLKNKSENNAMPSDMMEMNNMHEQMHQQMQAAPPKSRPPSRVPLPVVHFEPNVFGIRGLAKNIAEWGIQPLEMLSDGEAGKWEYVVLTLPSPVSRYPWEAFEKVGFRCVLSLSDTRGE
ncbi:MAG: protein kinase [Deltaproteobacteria bacterium]|nr:protein kinase [Deltaproteobacteria bacterium]